MNTIQLELSTDVYERLYVEATRMGESIQQIAQKWLMERVKGLAPVAISEREQARQVLRDAGLLAELGPAMKRRAAQSTATLEEVQTALDQAGGMPLSEMILEMRGPKV